MPIVGGGKERQTLIGSWRYKGITGYWNYLEDYWPCAGGLSALNAIGTRLRDPINSRLTRWCMVDAAVEIGRNPVSKRQIQPENGKVAG